MDSAHINTTASFVVQRIHVSQPFCFNLAIKGTKFANANINVISFFSYKSYLLPQDHGSTSI